MSFSATCTSNRKNLRSQHQCYVRGRSRWLNVNSVCDLSFSGHKTCCYCSFVKLSALLGITVDSTDLHVYLNPIAENVILLLVMVIQNKTFSMGSETTYNVSERNQVKKSISTEMDILF